MRWLRYSHIEGYDEVKVACFFGPICVPEGADDRTIKQRMESYTKMMLEDEVIHLSPFYPI